MIYEKAMNVDIFISFMECLIRGSSKLKEQVVAHMKKRSQDPTTVAKLFQHPKVAYAADDNHSLPE